MKMPEFRRLSRLLLLATCALANGSVAAGDTPPSNVTADRAVDESKWPVEMRAIAKAWRSRADQYKSVHVRWTFEVLPELGDECRVLLPQELTTRWGAVVGYVSGRRDWDIWLEGDERFRGLLSIRLTEGPRELRTVLQEAIRNRAAFIRSDLDRPWHPKTPASALLQSEPWSQVHPLLLVYRPADQLRGEWVFRTGNAVLGGIHCVKVEHTPPPDEGGCVRSLWLDRSRGYLPMHIESKIEDVVESISFDYMRDAQGLWALSAWYSQSLSCDPAPMRNTTRASVIEAAINPPIPPGLFDVTTGASIPTAVRAKSPN